MNLTQAFASWARSLAPGTRTSRILSRMAVSSSKFLLRSEFVSVSLSSSALQLFLKPLRADQGPDPGKEDVGAEALLDIIIDPLFEAPADQSRRPPSVADEEEQERVGLVMRLRAEHGSAPNRRRRSRPHMIRSGANSDATSPPSRGVAAEPDFDGLVFPQNPRDQVEGFRIVIDHEYA